MLLQHFRPIASISHPACACYDQQFDVWELLTLTMLRIIMLGGGLFTDNDISNLKNTSQGYAVDGRFVYRPVNEAESHCISVLPLSIALLMVLCR